jgi:hypothetical protein
VVVADSVCIAAPFTGRGIHTLSWLMACMQTAGSVIGHVGISFNLPQHHGLPCRPFRVHN